jgi:hypothetical protein
LIKEDFLKTSTLLNQAKKTVRDTDWHLKRLSEKVLPRCQSADITCDRIKRFFFYFSNKLYVYFGLRNIRLEKSSI